ncbi:hypothetical protein DFP72DRAFT_1044268 [Ephemerocybe angulata]|uniref:Uncharacterized protein n=1 Tax=Ephemerocybe angulata TaxID=980116 RepID=A0A8H6I1V7_9AGAR|nr:hypothetical protein DFP72DRAFT_1044268 [Tulosesus angulatus]
MLPIAFLERNAHTLSAKHSGPCALLKNSAPVHAARRRKGSGGLKYGDANQPMGDNDWQWYARRTYSVPRYTPVNGYLLTSNPKGRGWWDGWTDMDRGLSPFLCCMIDLIMPCEHKGYGSRAHSVAIVCGLWGPSTVWDGRHPNQESGGDAGDYLDTALWGAAPRAEVESYVGSPGNRAPVYLAQQMVYANSGGLGAMLTEGKCRKHRLADRAGTGEIAEKWGSPRAGAGLAGQGREATAEPRMQKPY